MEPTAGIPERHRAYRVEIVDGTAVAAVTDVPTSDLPDGEVTVAVDYSALNYKDALSARGRPGVTRNYPHTPGIDAAGHVLESRDSRFAPGDAVVVTSYGLGVDTPGGFGRLIRVPGDWVVPLPSGMSLRESMILGTAGLTAGLALDALERHGLEPGQGPVVVTGATGGVGSLAVCLLAQRGYEVIASTGTPEARPWLRDLGAGEVVDRQELGEPQERPLLRSRYAGAVDTVGGPTLANLVKSLIGGGAAAACGLVQSHRLELTVFPFILRGVALLGVDSAACPMDRRAAIWRRLAAEWKPRALERLATEIGLEQLDSAIDEILDGRTRGRVLVKTGAGR